MKLVEIVENVPQELRLDRVSSPVVLPDGGGCLFPLSDGQLLHLGPSAAQSLADLKLLPGEKFRICYQTGGVAPYWSVWLTPEAERARALGESPGLRLVRRRDPLTPKVAGGTVQTSLPGIEPEYRNSEVGSGKLAAIAGGRRAGGVIPMNVALREILQIVKSGLEAAGEDWGDEARQNAVSTLFIAAQKAGLLGPWERGA